MDSYTQAILDRIARLQRDRTVNNQTKARLIAQFENQIKQHEDKIIRDLAKLRQYQEQARKQYIYPRWIVVLDDLAVKELKNPFVQQLIRTNRHFHMKFFGISQTMTDFLPTQWRNADNIILFKGLSDARLIALKNSLTLECPMEKFIQIYRNATKEKYTPLVIDIKPQERYRKGLNHEYIFSKPDNDKEEDES